MSVEVPIEQLFDEVAQWGACYLLTVSEGERPHLLALKPQVDSKARLMRFDAGGGRACRNAATRPTVTLLFPPTDSSDGMSLVVDGTATVDGDIVSVAPTWAVLHRPAP